MKKAREAISNINATPGATREEKQEAIDRVNTLKNRALTDIGVTSTRWSIVVETMQSIKSAQFNRM